MAKQRAVRVEQKSALAAMQQLENRSDEELEAETRYRSAAQAILGARAAERVDARRWRRSDGTPPDAAPCAGPEPHPPARRSASSCGAGRRGRSRWPSAAPATS